MRHELRPTDLPDRRVLLVRLRPRQGDFLRATPPDSVHSVF